MAEPIIKFFRGLTTQHIGVVWLLCGFVFWIAQIKPSIQKAEDAHQGLTKEVGRIADTLDTFRQEVAEIRTEVKIHGVLIASMTELKSDIKELRNDIAITNTRITNWKEP